MTDEEILEEARECFDFAVEFENDTRVEGLDDLRFARLGEQWPEALRLKREKEDRPCLTSNDLPTYIRQVVNDVRQNKPGIIVHPADDHADVETAEIYNGLIRHIQVTSDADVATDTGCESAVSNGFGYFGIDITDDGDDLAFRRIANPFSVYGDPWSEAADSSDWNRCFIVSTISKDRFEQRYKGAEPVDWDALGYTGLGDPWFDGDEVMVAEYWRREPVTLELVQLADGSTIAADDYDEVQALLTGNLKVARKTKKSHKVTQYILTGAEVLETNEWPGIYIPIVPVYGDEINVEGKRYFRSLINAAKDAKRMANYWETAATEIVALAPKTPFVGEQGAFEVDQNWETANDVSHPFLEYAKGSQPPQRQPFPSVPAGFIQEALNARDRVKSIIGIYDASLGARSNETSGKAILARQREGDVSTFHFIDNLSRAIRHAGRILLDLIPHVYNRERVLRILGEDMKPRNVRIAPGQASGQTQPEQDGIDGEALDRVYDLGVGKYDLIVKTGPSYSSLREEAREQLVEMINSYPEARKVLGPLYLRNSDWPGAEKAADEVEQAGEPPPEMAAMQAQQMQQQAQMAQQAQQMEMAKLQADIAKSQADAQTELKKLELDQARLALDAKKLEIEELKAHADMLRAETEAAAARQAQVMAANPYMEAA